MELLTFQRDASPCQVEPSQSIDKNVTKSLYRLCWPIACSMFDVIALSVVYVALFLLLVTFAGSDYYIFNQCELQGFLTNMFKKYGENPDQGSVSFKLTFKKLETKITCTK